MEFIDYYSVLGVQKNAGADDIRKHIESLQSNITLMQILMMLLPRKSFSK